MNTLMVKTLLSTVDLQNGEYTGLFVLPEPGEYEIHIILEYSACEGITDPPKDWFRKGKKSFTRIFLISSRVLILKF